MTVWITTAVAVFLGLLNLAQFIFSRLDTQGKRIQDKKDADMRYTEHFRQMSDSLLEENDRLRERIDDTDKHCAAQLAALRTENDALGQRIIALVRSGNQP